MIKLNNSNTFKNVTPFVKKKQLKKNRYKF